MSQSRQIDLGDTILANGREATVKMVGDKSVRVEYKYGGVETVPKSKCHLDYDESDIEKEVISLDFERYDGKQAGHHIETQVPMVSVSTETLSFNKSACEAGNFSEYSYADYYLSDDPDVIGLKPVSGGDVDGNSYKLTDGSVAFTRVSKEIGWHDYLSYRSKKIECQWHEDREMMVIDLSAIREMVEPAQTSQNAPR